MTTIQYVYHPNESGHYKPLDEFRLYLSCGWRDECTHETTGFCDKGGVKKDVRGFTADRDHQNNILYHQTF